MAWIIAELVNNASGFGFNGYDTNGNAKWDLLTNVNIIKLEVIKLVFFFLSFSLILFLAISYQQV
jgi:lysophospholipid acyltransferase 1/2